MTPPKDPKTESKDDAKTKAEAKVDEQATKDAQAAEATAASVQGDEHRTSGPASKEEREAAKAGAAEHAEESKHSLAGDPLDGDHDHDHDHDDHVVEGGDPEAEDPSSVARRENREVLLDQNLDELEPDEDGGTEVSPTYKADEDGIIHQVNQVWTQ